MNLLGLCAKVLTTSCAKPLRNQTRAFYRSFDSLVRCMPRPTPSLPIMCPEAATTALQAACRGYAFAKLSASLV